MSQTAVIAVPRSSRLARAGEAFRTPLVRMVGRRVLAAVPVLWGVTFLTFCLLNLLPGDAAQQLLGINATPQEVHALELKLHLNESFWVRYWHWFSGIVTGHLGTSLASNQPVSNLIAERLPVTAELALYAIVMALVFAIPLAVLAAKLRGRFLDKAVTTFSMAGLSIPGFVFGLVLIIVFSVKIRLFPATGFTPIGKGLGANLQSLTLPAATIALALLCTYTRILRGDLVEQMESHDYVLTARLKGLSATAILFKHALRNASFGLITITGLTLGALLGGTVISEQIFGLPGMGSEMLSAINNRDIPVVEAIVVIIAVAVVVLNLLVDVIYSILDPRIRHDRAN